MFVDAPCEQRDSLQAARRVAPGQPLCTKALSCRTRVLLGVERASRSRPKSCRQMTVCGRGRARRTICAWDDAVHACDSASRKCAARASNAQATLGLRCLTADPQTGVALGMAQCRNVRSKRRCSMCPAIHISSRSWLRSSSTHEPSDPSLRVISCQRMSTCMDADAAATSSVACLPTACQSTHGSNVQ